MIQILSLIHISQQIAQELEELTYFMPEVQVACVYGGANMEKQAKRLAEGWYFSFYGY